MASQAEHNVNYGPVASLCGLIFFWITYSIYGKCIPAGAQKSTYLAWRWRNIANSFTHAVLSGTSALLCFYLTPELAEDVVGFYTPFSHLLLSFSIGYFFFDFVDMLRNSPRSRNTCELTVHHAAVTLCFAISMWTKRYVGYGIVSLLVEVNSIFLHLRQLLHIQGFNKDYLMFRINSLINIGTFLIFRIFTLAWMARWLLVNPNAIHVPVAVYYSGCVSVCTITCTSTVLFCRILIADFFRQRPREAKDSNILSLSSNMAGAGDATVNLIMSNTSFFDTGSGVPAKKAN